VQFTLPLPEAIKYSGYRAVLQRGGAQVFSQELPRDALINSGKAIMVSITSMSLRPGRYILYVTGRHAGGPYQTVQYYAFFVKA
jgi:cystathionine beta-lyase family protein involved in aluminum resistance